MKKIMVIAALAAAGSADAQVKPKTTKAVPVKTAANPLKNAIDSFSYAAGLSVGQSMKDAGAEKLNAQLFAKALDVVFSNGKSFLTKEQANMTLQQKLAEFNKKRTDAQKAEGMAFLEKNKKRAGVTALPNGLQYEVLKAGDPAGPKPLAVDTVIVNYVGTLTDGTEFDNSVKRGQAATFPLNGVIRGWTEILQLMPKGSHWKVYIPGDLAYGENSPSPQIPPNAVLVFEITLEDIKPAKNVAAQ